MLRETTTRLVAAFDHRDIFIDPNPDPAASYAERKRLFELPMDFLDVSDIDLGEFSSMYWGLGAQILRTAKRISALPNAFGLHLTNFGCGADSFIEHFYRHVMGSKAYLILELDEHSAVAGIMTRLEAFRNVIENTMQKSECAQEMELLVAN